MPVSNISGIKWLFSHKAAAPGIILVFGDVGIILQVIRFDYLFKGVGAEQEKQHVAPKTQELRTLSLSFIQLFHHQQQTSPSSSQSQSQSKERFSY